MNEVEELFWISEEWCCELLKIKSDTLRNRCQQNIYKYIVKKKGNKNEYFIHIDSLENDIQQKIKKIIPAISEKNENGQYSEVPSWAKAQALKYISIIKNVESLRGKALKEYINKWNIHHPEFKTSYPNLLKMKKRYQKYGIAGLLSKKGFLNKTTVDDKYFYYFKDLYLKEGAPSLRTCWDSTLGYAIRTDNVDIEKFPTCTSFWRRLQKELPKQSICLARQGESSWNRKYSNYIERDYSNISCGKVWVSDHAQVDIACMTEEGNIVFPWVTVWRDFKSGKWLGWLLQSGHPNSDHIFQTFYYAARDFGLPDDVIIDNGKDYRSKDFAGGRKIIKLENNKPETRAMLAELDVDVHFALPYNAQTKPVERDFLKIKGLLSKHSVGYRGGNVVERPEILDKEIKQAKILPFEKFKTIFDDFIINILNKKPTDGVVLKGLSPDEFFNKEFKEKKITSKDALKLFCMRTSRNFTVGRNGIKDKQLGITYWADWMSLKTGLKVYLRRDVQNYKEAWAFKADNDEFVGKAKAVKAVAALHADEVSKEAFKEALAIKKRNFKIAKSFIETSREITLEEKCENYKALYDKVIEPAQPKITKIANTNMDKAIRKSKEMESFGQYDLSKFPVEEKLSEEHLYLFETDKLLDEEMRGAG